MKKVINTKYRSIKQMENMVYNLREKFNVYCSIEHIISLDAHIFVKEREVGINEHYHVYVMPNSDNCKSWQELLQHYYKLMG